MRKYDYREKWKKLLTPEIVSYLSQIHEFKGEQTLFIEAKADTLTQLVEIAKIQSTEASNKIEGIYTSDERLRALVKDVTRPKTRNEREIAGYRDVLNTIHENHDYIPPKPSIILQLHRDLYKFEGFHIGGKYKSAISDMDYLRTTCQLPISSLFKRFLMCYIYNGQSEREQIPNSEPISFAKEYRQS